MNNGAVTRYYSNALLIVKKNQEISEVIRIVGGKTYHRMIARFVKLKTSRDDPCVAPAKITFCADITPA